MTRFSRSWVIALSIVVALMLSAIPMPTWAVSWKPPWVALVLIYWSMALPMRVGVMTGWIVGFLMDVLQGAILGQHALGMAMVSYVALIYHQRVRVFPLRQQAMFVGLLSFAYLLVMLALYNLTGSLAYGWDYLLGAVSAALLWPWVYIMLRDLRRRAGLQ
jgi:rod shape-determining protein MreD